MKESAEIRGIPETFGIVGAGAFGRALAIAAERAGRRVVLYGRRPLSEMPSGIATTATLGDIAACDALLLTTPAQATRTIADELATTLRQPPPIIVCAKGIERDSGRFPSEIVAEALPAAPVAVLSGPSFAADVAAGLPTAVVLATPDAVLAERLAKSLNSPSFRVYHSTDRRGVETGGAAKNVLAIAAGIVEGQGLGESAKAALVARGFAEMRRFAAAIGAEAETLMGLSGLGDLMLTAGSARSRNFSYGLALGRGSRPEDAAGVGLSEGAQTAAVLASLAARHGVEMPISAAVAAIIEGRLTVRDATELLVSRPQKAE